MEVFQFSVEPPKVSLWSKYMNKFREFVFVVFTIILLINTAWPSCPPGDLDNNCFVDSGDLRILALNWLQPTSCSDSGCPDLYIDNFVNFLDFSVLAENWNQGSINTAWSFCPPGDLDNNCKVDLVDLRLFTLYWLHSTSCSGSGCPDLYNDNAVDFMDFNILALNWYKHGYPLIINEIMASNNTILEDPNESGEFPDWIEIYNRSNYTIDLGGMYLTDNLTETTKWQIPDGITIEPNEYLVFFADGDDEQGPLHTNFDLGKGGEEIWLFDTDFTTIIDGFVFGHQTTDISFGCEPDANDNRVTLLPTPGLSNNDSYIGVVADTTFSTDRGFYENPFEVAITCDTEEVNIIYTTDGSKPTWPLIGAGKKYTKPVSIDETTVLRAQAFKAAFKSTNIDTHTYVFIDDVITQSSNGDAPGPDWPAPHTGSYQHIDYGMDPDVVNDSRYSTLIDDALLAIPTLSIVTDLANLFDADTGIYMNALEEAIEWERPTSLELIYPDGEDGFQVDAGLRIRGGWSRHNDCPKHAFRLFFRSKYGNANLKFPMFDDEGTDEFDKIDLRTAQNYSWSFTGDNRNTFLRDVFSRDMQRHMGQPYTRSRYYHLYINGQYWGLYQTQERSEAQYAASYFGGDDSDYDVVKADGGPTGTKKAVATDGNIDAYVQLWDLANKLDDASEGLKMVLYQQMQGNNPDGSRNPDFDVLLDVDNVIDYMLCTYYVGDKDGPISNFMGDDKLNNFFCIYNRHTPDGFKFFRHDAEHSLDTGLSDRTGPYTVINEKVNADYFNPQTLHQWLIEQPDYRMQFADHVYKHFFNDGQMTQAAASDSITNRQNQIDLAIIAESARWGDAKHHPPRTKDDDWLSAVDGVRNFFSARVSTVLNQFKSKGWYPDFDPPVFYIEGTQQHGGPISKFDELTMNASGGTIYYTLDGSDPRHSGVIYNTTLIHEDALKKVLIPTEHNPDNSTWRIDPYFDDSGWLDYDFISEKYGGVGYDEYSNYLPYITYDVEHQMKNINTSCYIRIPFNINAEDLVNLNLMTLRLRYDDGFIAYLNGTEIARSNFLGSPSWNSQADQIHSDSLAVNFQEFDADNYLVHLQSGDNILAIHGLNVGLSSSDFLISTELIIGQNLLAGVSDTAIEYDSAVAITESTRVKARVLYNDEWSALSEATYAIGPVLDNLRITEIMYNPKHTGDPNDSDAEFIELKNIGDESINLNLVSFTKGIDFTFPNIEIEPNEYVLVVKDLNAFSSQGHDVPVSVEILYPYEGRLDNDGERIRLEDAIGRTILDFKYEDNWRPITDGQGYSLTIVNSYTEPNNYSEKASWAASTLQNGSPGSDDTGPKPGDIVINELLAHSDTSDDWIELYNASRGTIDIGGWFLSDDNGDLKKYEIAVGTIIDANDYIVFYEDANFGSLSTDPGSNVSFALSENGETVCLSSGRDSQLTGFREEEKFGASQKDIAFGRYYKSSTDSYNFVAMSINTPGSANAYPKVGPIVINEIMYNPPSGGVEYVELRNITNNPANLFDAEGNSWKFTEGFDFEFPPNTTISAADDNVNGNGFFLVVDTNEPDFRAKYSSVPANVGIFGPFNDKSLSNSGEKVEISMPGDWDYDVLQYIRIDCVKYSDGSHPENCPQGIDLWPKSPDGSGDALHRKVAQEYGNDVANWQAAPSSPGY